MSGDIQGVVGTLKGVEVAVPASEMMILLVVLTLCLCFRTTRFGLMTAFLGTYRWAWIVFKDDLATIHPYFLYGYYLFGVIVVILTLLTWFFAEE